QSRIVEEASGQPALKQDLGQVRGNVGWATALGWIRRAEWAAEGQSEAGEGMNGRTPQPRGKRAASWGRSSIAAKAAWPWTTPRRPLPGRHVVRGQSPPARPSAGGRPRATLREGAE